MRYNAILKVKKQQLDKAENNLLNAKKRRQDHEEAMRFAKEELRNLELVPSSGSSKDLKMNLSLVKLARTCVLNAKAKLELSQKELNHYQYLYQRAYVDYEKMKFLENEELQKQHKELKKAEEKFLDEIAISRFFKRQNGAR